MIDLENLNVRQLRTSYLVSNTPAFLYDQFRADPSVQRLAVTSDSDELAQHVERVALQDVRTVEDMVSAYAAFIALMLQRYPAVDKLQGKQFASLQWASDLLKLYDERGAGNEIVSVQASPRTPDVNQTSATTSNSSIILSDH